MMNGKPDAYSLISSASFAIMSLSLSRQTQCGFEVDLLYFFLGCLIVQLMKIKLELFIVGAGFSYSLIVLRSSFPSTSTDVGEDNEYPRIQDENSVVLHVISPPLTSIDTVSSMMEQLRTCLNAIQHENFYVNEMLSEQSNESEFMLSDHSLEGMFMLESVPLKTIKDLQETVKLMVSAGFEKECCKVYSSCRREFLEEFFVKQLLDFQNGSTEDVNMIPWKDLRGQIGTWIKASKVALKIVFPTEQQLCDLVFIGFSTVADLSFTEVCKGCANHLLRFANAFANGSRSPERLFRILDVFEALRDLIPEFESLFCDQYIVSLRNEANTILKKLGEAIVGIFMELEDKIRQNPTKSAIPGGGLHPIVRYVMNYLVLTCEYWQTLEGVFEDHGHQLKEYLKIDDSAPSSSYFEVQMDRIMEALESNLEAQSKTYKDPTLCYVFLMNSSRYICQKIKDSELGQLLTDDMIRKHKVKVQQNYEQYERTSWTNVMGFLKLDDNELVLPNMVVKSMKKKLKSFNILFGEICRVQSSWFVLDEQLKEDIRISIERNLLPAYGNFIGKFHSVPKLGKYTDKYIKYETEDIKARLNDLFQGSSGSTNTRK